MPYYSVSHPQLELTATVEAPSSEKARTTFLDYLERTGKARRDQRQLLRRAMATKKLEDENEGYSDLVLHYEYERAPEESILQLGEPEPSFEDYSNLEQVEQPPEQPPVTGQPQAPVASKMMPIQELALTGKVGG